MDCNQGLYLDVDSAELTEFEGTFYFAGLPIADAAQFRQEAEDSMNEQLDEVPSISRRPTPRPAWKRRLNIFLLFSRSAPVNQPAMLTLIIAALWAQTASAGDMARAYDRLKALDMDWQNYGNVCEQLAADKLRDNWRAPEYEVVVGVAYMDDGSVIGELDEVVLRRRDGEVVLLAEVKCWQDLGKAYQKATEQQARFREALASGRDVDFYLTSDKGRTFTPAQFDTVGKFIFISQDGGERSGFDLTIDYTLPEVYELREALLKCQHEKKCSNPFVSR